ncbi:MAG TPA: glycoside hydrolase family 3 N-terminal domain-containing protein [Nitrospiraceae bacterium]|nr:glycoside hydrolase family 3 N-terminal domain-containing protein [Nitrospiraceae bacterium]
MLYPGFRGAVIPHWLEQFAHSYGLGGVILFDFNCQTRTYENNIYTPSQVRDLCAEIAALPSHPLLFVDQEGGRVRRLKDARGFAPLPSQQNFNLLSETEKRRVIAESFMQLRRLGFHYNLAPVVDLNLNPLNPDIGAVERSYSADANEVRANVEIVNAAAKEAGIGLSLKHFPGLGGAHVNSHHELTDILDTISDDQLSLFYELGQTISGTSMVVSHGIVHQWEKDTPVSMSPIGIGKVRERLPDALLISDDLQMQGLQKKYSTQEACGLGLRAGLDMLCIGNNLMPEDELALSHAEAVSQLMTTDVALAKRVSLACVRVANTKAQFTRT